MAEKYDAKTERGHCGIGIYGAKFESNVGTLWRTAFNFSADFIYTIGKRYKPQRSDVVKAYKHIPMYEYETWDEFKVPRGSELVCVEINDHAKDIHTFNHPEQAVYLLGAEDHGLPKFILDDADHIIKIPTHKCANVSMIGGICLYDRQLKKAVDIGAR
jgi:tRNA G18 (ribose-2'-O)-methylase SpoU